MAADARTLTLRVEVRDPDHVAVDQPGLYWQGDCVQFGLDTSDSSAPGEPVQFQVALTKGGPVVWKDKVPYIGGDLPGGWTPAGRPAEHVRAVIAPIAGGMRYIITIDVTELYPLIPERGHPLRFSLLVNSNRGQGRNGWVEWGSGIGGEANTAAYGVLAWR